MSYAAVIVKPLVVNVISRGPHAEQNADQALMQLKDKGLCFEGRHYEYVSLYYAVLQPTLTMCEVTLRSVLATSTSAGLVYKGGT